MTKAQIVKRFNQCCQDKGTSQLPVGSLHRLCQELHLHILCVSEDMSYMFKYQDLVSRKAEQSLGNRGYISK